jgi:hypothetical protein
MTHSFDVEVAQRFGIDEAIILNNMFFWIQKNEANHRHFHDGHYWTYNSVEAFCDIFPYWSAPQIKRILKRMEEKGIVLTGNYNSDGRDRTKWYALPDFVYCIFRNRPIQQTNSSHSLDGIVPPLPDSNPDNKPDKKHTPSQNSDIKNEDVFFGHDFSDRLKAKLKDWLAYKAEKRESYKPTGLKSFMSVVSNKLKTYCEADILSLIDDCMANNWQGIIWDRLKGKERGPSLEDNWGGIPKL